MVMKYICQYYFPLQDPPKFTQNWDFWFENKPSGSPDNAEKSWSIKKVTETDISVFPRPRIIL
jgi:hypothetical protein